MYFPAHQLRRGVSVTDWVINFFADTPTGGFNQADVFLK